MPTGGQWPRPPGGEGQTLRGVASGLPPLVTQEGTTPAPSHPPGHVQVGVPGRHSALPGQGARASGPCLVPNPTSTWLGLGRPALPQAATAPRRAVLCPRVPPARAGLQLRAMGLPPTVSCGGTDPMAPRMQAGGAPKYMGPPCPGGLPGSQAPGLHAGVGQSPVPHRGLVGSPQGRAPCHWGQP